MWARLGPSTLGLRLVKYDNSKMTTMEFALLMVFTCAIIEALFLLYAMGAALI